VLCEDEFGLRLKLGKELLDQEEDNTGAAEGKRKAERSESILRKRGRGGVVMRVRARNGNMTE
jgi:hypothetical protein